MKALDWKKFAPYIGIIAGFFALSLFYFSPQLSGKVMDTHDYKQWYGSAQEGRDHLEETGELALWTNSQFGGMPAYYVFIRYPNNLFREIKDVFSLWLDRPAGYFIVAMLSFFVLGLVLRLGPFISGLGAIMYSFNSYLFVITAAGHFAKTNALSYLPALFAGIILIYRRKYIAGLALTALAFCLELIAIHPQMTYYFVVFLLVPYGVYELICAAKKKELKQFFISSAVAVVAVILGLLPNISQLWVTQEYTPYSTRGASELTLNEGDQTSGLDKSYILSWSNGIAETWSLMIPDAKGGASGRIAEDKTAMAAVDRKYRQVMSSVDKYWGDQPFTGGPMYSGAVVVFLFMLGLFFVQSKFKWVIVFAAVITTLLSWGNNFMPLSEFFIDHFPLYNKFRAVASIQTVTHYCLPILAMLGVREIVKNKDEFFQEKFTAFGKVTGLTNLKVLFIAFGLTGGLAILFALMPTTFFDFFKTGEVDKLYAQMSGGGMAATNINAIIDNIEDARVAIFKSSAWRSGGFIIVAFAVVLLFSRKLINQVTLIAILAVLALVDLWSLDKQYLNDDNFVKERNLDQPFPKSPANDFILSNEGLNDRVLNLAASTFNETGTSYFHKSIGGYSGVKMKRYQEVVEYHLSGEIESIKRALSKANTMQDVQGALQSANVLNALNTRFIIYNPQSQPILNQYTYGNTWFVGDVVSVPSANEEVMKMKEVSLKNTAVIREEFTSEIPNNISVGTIELTNYKPDHLTYQSSNSGEGIAVFGEIYYPEGWKVYIDGEETDYLRVDYFLRGLVVPAGEHTIEFKFEPSSYHTGESISLAGSILLVLVLIGAVVYELKFDKKEC